jgi:hypothetical protein
MEKFITNKKYTEEVINLFKNSQKKDEILCAVAFWGDDATKKLIKQTKAKIRIICNLDSGATNPKFIESIIDNERIKIKNNGKLHAKVFISSDRSIVGSANASANGLGFSDGEIEGWIEAGVFSNTPQLVKTSFSWFNELWGNSKDITSDDIRDAKLLWLNRHSNRPTILFLDYPENELEKIKIWWWSITPAFITNKHSVIKTLGYHNKSAEDKIQDSIDIEEMGDQKYVPPKSWVLRWHRTNDGRLARGKEIEWFYTGEFVPDAGSYKGDNGRPISVIIRGENPPPPPFEIRLSKDPIFCKAFGDIVSSNKYHNWIYQYDDEDPNKPWLFKNTIIKLPEFWRDLRGKYIELKKG